jgi:hypothetical protein
MEHCLVAFGLLLQLAGCAHAPLAAATRSARDNEDALATDLANHCRQHRHGDALVLLTISLDALPLASAKQTQVARLEIDLLEKMRPARQAKHELLRILADGLMSPGIDRAKVGPALAGLAAATLALRDSALDDLNQLHALLSPSERAALSDALVAHEACWHDCGISERVEVSSLVAQLGLTPRQRELLDHDTTLLASTSAPPRGAPSAQRLEAAFRSDSFDARALLVAGANLDIEAWQGLVRFCEQADRLLADQQRRQLRHLIGRLESIYDEGRPSH